MSSVPREAREPVSNTRAVIGNIEMQMKENKVEFSKENKIYEIAGENLINKINTVEIPVFEGSIEQTQRTDNEQQK